MTPPFHTPEWWHTLAVLNETAARAAEKALARGGVQNGQTPADFRQAAKRAGAISASMVRRRSEA